MYYRNRYKQLIEKASKNPLKNARLIKYYKSKFNHYDKMYVRYSKYLKKDQKGKKTHSQRNNHLMHEV